MMQSLVKVIIRKYDGDKFVGEDKFYTKKTHLMRHARKVIDRALKDHRNAGLSGLRTNVMVRDLNNKLVKWANK